jgi:thioesterase domain-containing protein/acyl carrier protein
MLPSHLVAVERLPHTPAGKVDRRELAGRTLETPPGPAAVPPRNEREQHVADICREVIGVASLGMTDNLFELGAHSMRLAAILARVEAEFRVRIPVAALFQTPTAGHLCSLIHDPAGRSPRVGRVRPSGGRPPLFWVAADPMFRPLADRLPEDQPFIALFLADDHQLPQPFTIEQVAAYHLATLRREQPAGPYYLGGFCAAGVVACEMARQIEQAGDSVSFLALLDSRNPAALPDAPLPVRHLRQLQSMGPRRYLEAKRTALLRNLDRRAWNRRYERGELPEGGDWGSNPEFLALRFASGSYRPQPICAPTVLFRNKLEPGSRLGHDYGWKTLIPNLKVKELPGGHLGMHVEPNLGTLAESLAAFLRRTQSGSPQP